jgi:predicted component of type VI protein secretion system
LDEHQFRRFLPHSEAAAALAALLAAFDAARLRYEVRLRLQASAVRPLTLSTRQPGVARQLGWNTFLTTGARPIENASIGYLLASG